MIAIAFTLDQDVGAFEGEHNGIPVIWRCVWAGEPLRRYLVLVAYTDACHSDHCVDCLRGECVQRIVQVTTDEAAIVHGCASELS